MHKNTPTHWWQENHAVVNDHVIAWRNDATVVPSHSPPIHPFDAHRRVFAFFNNEAYTPGEVPNDTPPLRALIHEYDRWFLLTLLRNFRYDDAKASERRNILWHLVHHDPYTEPYDCGDFMRAKINHRTQNHRASHDEPMNAIHDNTTSVSPSGLTSTMPGQSYPQPQSHQQLQAYPPAPPTSQSATLGLPEGYPRSFDGLALIAFYEQEMKAQASDVNNDNGVVPTFCYHQDHAQDIFSSTTMTAICGAKAYACRYIPALFPVDRQGRRVNRTTVVGLFSTGRFHAGGNSKYRDVAGNGDVAVSLQKRQFSVDSISLMKNDRILLGRPLSGLNDDIGLDDTRESSSVQTGIQRCLSRASFLLGLVYSRNSYATYWVAKRMEQ
ncbi:hypothetical protein EDD18DRAFT_1333789 [Armillaria luteobubalina]|uniref:Uncharacterized protein n=1 Tax=Armillaria luteobubalina TaxID=153913 RepID=A0AA39Q0M5_9AGAR|nr:hypothetical protein EDD18DRAFT_1333789 [Armillaria luteobubalina]